MDVDSIDFKISPQLGAVLTVREITFLITLYLVCGNGVAALSLSLYSGFLVPVTSTMVFCLHYFCVGAYRGSASRIPCYIAFPSSTYAEQLNTQDIRYLFL
jgi:hypothetical protein